MIAARGRSARVLALLLVCGLGGCFVRSKAEKRPAPKRGQSVAQAPKPAATKAPTPTPTPKPKSTPAKAAKSAPSKATERYIEYLEGFGRADWQKPEQVVEALHLKPGSAVTDLGAGTGYFSRRLAAIVGPTGSVDAVDIDAGLLENLERRAATAKIENIRTRKVARDDPEMAPSSADLVFVCNTYHDLRDRVVYLRKVAAGLKPEGRVVIVDFHKSAEVPEGPALDQKVDRETVVSEFREAGFTLEREETFLPYQYFLVFKAASSFSFAPLVRSVRGVMRSEAPDREKQAELAALLGDYLREHRLEDRFLQPDPKLPVTTYLLHTDPEGLFSIAVLVFQPMATTTIHDHQSWVVWGTYDGEERETRYKRTDIAGQSFPKLDVAWSKVFSAGDISFIDPPPGDIHDVANVKDEISVSIHVHATDIGKQPRNTYDVKNQIVRSFVQTYEPAM